MAKRPYKEEFLDLGFMHITARGIIKLQCVICGEDLSNESFKENKLRRHLEGKHSAFVAKQQSFFERKEQQMNRQKPHTIGEELVKPEAVDMVRTVCGGDVTRKIEHIPLLNDTCVHL